MPMLWSKRPNTKIAPQNYDAVRLMPTSTALPELALRRLGQLPLPPTYPTCLA